MNHTKGYISLMVWLAIAISFIIYTTAVNAQLIEQEQNTGSAPTWLSQTQSTDTGDVVLEWLPVAGTNYYHIQQSFTAAAQFGLPTQAAETSPHYIESSTLAFALRTPGSYEFSVRACTRTYDNGRPLGAQHDSCTGWSDEITITVTAQAMANSRQVTAPVASGRAGTGDGPNLITPGEWAAPSRKGHGWSFFWANHLRAATETGIIIEPDFDLIGVWYTYGQILPGNDDWVPVWLYMNMQETITAGVYEGNIMYGSYIVDGGCPVGVEFEPADRQNDVESCRQSIGTFTLDFSNTSSPKASWNFTQGTGFCNNNDIPCQVNNVELISGDKAIDDAIGDPTKNPSTPVPDLEHFSGFWWSWTNPPENPGQADLDQRFGLSRFIEGNIEANVLIYYDAEGYRIWSRFDDNNFNTAPSAGNTEFCGRYRVSGYPAAWEYVTGSNMLGASVELPCEPSNQAFMRSLQNTIEPGINRHGNLDINFTLPAEANRTAGLSTSGSIDHRKATTFNDVRLFVNGSAILNEDFTCYTGNANADVCPAAAFVFTLTAFTDFDYNTTLRRVNADNGTSTYETSLNGESSLVDYGVEPISAGRYYYALYRDIPGSDTLLAKSRTIEVIAGSDPNTLPEIPDAALGTGTTLHNRPAHNPAVGKLAGSGGVSGGAASYNIPINAPPGINGMQPSVSINYNSRAGNGLLGMGWSLSAGSSISRCPATVAQDGFTLGITFTDTDRLCLDGQRLIRINGTDYWAGGGEYRTEIESFKRIKMSAGSGPTSTNMRFTVENKDGTVDTYGSTPASRGTVFRDSGSPSSQTVSWHINTKTDPSGNRMDYLYQQGNRTGGQIADTGAPFALGAPGTGEIILTAIAYTGKGSSQGTRRIEFIYDDRCVGSICDDSISYVSGFNSEQLLALSRIQTCVSGNICGLADMIREYELTYTPSQATGRLLLASAQERARDGTAWIELPATSFDWGDEQPQYNFEKLRLSGQTLVNSMEGSCNEVNEVDDFDYCNWGDSNTDQRPPGIRMAGDYDGNGTREMLAVIGGNRYLIGTDADGNMLGKARFNIDSSTEFITNESLRSDADFNNDGRVDIVGITPSATNPNSYVYAIAQWKPGAVWTNNSNQFVSDFFDIRRTSIIVAGFTGNDNEAAPINIPMIADIDSDGKKDILLLSQDGTSIEVYINIDNNAFTAGSSDTIIFDNPVNINLPPFDDSITLARPSLQDYDGDGVVDIGIQASILLDVGGTPVRLVDGNGIGLIGVLFNNVPTDQSNPPAPLGNLFDYIAASPFGAAGDTLNTGLAFDPRQTFHLPLDINGDGLTDYIYMPAGDGGEPTSSGNFWHYQLNSGSVSRTNLYLPSVNTMQPVGRIQTSVLGIDSPRQFPTYASLIRTVDSNNDGRQEFMVPASVFKGVCLIQSINNGNGVGTYCPVQPDYTPLQSDGCEDITSAPSGNNETCEIYAKGFGNSDQSLYNMKILSFNYEHSSAIYTLSEATGSNQPVYGNAFSSDDLFGDGINNIYGRVGCIGPDPANGGVIGIDQTNCGAGAFTDNNQLPTDDIAIVGSDIGFFIQNDRNYYQNKLINNRTDVLDLMLSATDGFNLTAEWDYAPLSSDADRPEVSFPLYATPSRENGDSMFRAAGSNGMEDYFLFTSSMYVVSSFKSPNGVNVNSQNTTWYGYEEAVFNNKGRGFQGFKAIHTEMHAPNDDLGSIAANPRTRSTTIFRQDFPYAGLIQCQYTVLAEDGFIAAAECPSVLSSAPNTRPPTTVSPITLTWNDWAKLTDISTETADCGSHRGGMNPVVFLPYKAMSIAETTKMLSPGTLVTSTATTTELDNCGNVIEQTQDRTDHGFYTLSTTTNTEYEYNQVSSNWWLNKTDKSTSSKFIVYDSGQPGHAMPPTDTLVGFAGEGGSRTTSTSFNWNATHRQPSCVLQYEGSNNIACTSTPSGTWSRQAITYDGYGNTLTMTQTASAETASRLTTTNFGTDGYFPTTITNALNQATSTEFDQSTGNPTQITDANGLLTKFEYDPFGREIERFFPDDDTVAVNDPTQQYAPRTSTRYQWVSSCASGVNCYTVKTITDGAPIVTETRDRLNRVIQSTRNGYNDLVTSGQQFNGRGQVVAQSEPRYGTIPSNIGTTMSYDALGRLIHKAQDRDGGVGQLHTHYQHNGLHTRVRLTTTEVPPGFDAQCSGLTSIQLLCVDRYIGSQGQTLLTKDAAGESTMFWYDANGNPVLIEDADANLTGANYNAFSQRTSLWDPNMGGTDRNADMTFSYNGYGELKTQTDAKGQVTSFTYDKLGRMQTRNAPGIQDLWDYDPPNAVGQLEYMRRNQNGQTVYERDFSYDAFARATGHLTEINNTSSGQQTFEVQIQPDGYFGRPVSMVYPTAFADTTLPLQTYHLYDINGYLTQEGLGWDLVNATDPQDVPFYRKINDMSPRDQLVNVEYGNDAVDTWLYGPANGQMSAMMSAMPGLPDLLADLAYDYDEVGNLVLQTNYLTNVEEQFNYDLLHRLTSRLVAPIAETTPIEPPLDGPSGPSAPIDPQPAPFITPEGVDYQYDALGNITGKSDYASNYEYLHNFYPDACPFGINGAVTPGPHAVTRVSTINRRHDGQTSFTPRRMAYDANGNMICSEDGSLTVQYDAFNLPTNIQRGFVTQNFNYGPDLQRYRQQSQGTETMYIDKLYERKGDIERYYLGGYLVIERNSAGQDTHSYTHKDRLGSTVAITDDAGDIKVQQGFGPFGKARDEFWEAQDALPGKAYDSRGFTDHEHLDNTRLIHMNGRAYDYNLGRFLSVDPIIQFPSNSQSLNPYSYLMNNPMAGTDPTGYVGVSCTGTRILRANCDSFNPTTLSSSSATDEGNDSSSTRFRLLSAQAAARQNGASDSEGTTDSDGSGRLTNDGGPNDTGAPRSRAAQNTFTPNAQGDGVGCGVPLQCAGNTGVNPTLNVSLIDSTQNAGTNNSANPFASFEPDTDLGLLARIIFAEAGIDFMKPGALQAVGSVILNRVASTGAGIGFPDTVSKVIFDPNQFDGAISRNFINSANPNLLAPGDQRAFAAALETAQGLLDSTLNDNTNRSLFFFSGPDPNIGPDSFFQSRIDSGRFIFQGRFGNSNFFSDTEARFK